MTKGSCLCGAVVFEITGKTTDIGMCHCSKCRKVSGVASNATLMTSREGLVWISGEGQISKFELPSGWGAVAVFGLRVAGFPSSIPMAAPIGFPPAFSTPTRVFELRAISSWARRRPGTRSQAPRLSCSKASEAGR